MACGGAAAPTTSAPEAPQVTIQAPVVVPTIGSTAVVQPTAEPVVVVEGKYGGIVNMVQYADVRQRLIAQSAVLNMTLSPIFNTLMEFNPETDDSSDLRCDLCTHWSLAEDGVTYTFKIHPDANWADGVPVTADDVVFSLEAQVNPDQFKILEGRSTSSTVNTGLYYDTGNSRAIDAKTVEIKTRFPAGAFLTALSIEQTMIQPRHTVIDQGLTQGGKDLDALNGSGPFKFVSFEKEVSVEYEKNPNYFKEGRPFVDGLKHFIIVDSGRVIAAFKTGQILMPNGDRINISPQEAKLLDQKMDNLTVHWAGPAGAFYFMMNTTQAPFDDIRVRRAVHLAIYRQPVIQTFSGGVFLMGYPNPPGFWYSYSDEEMANLPDFRELNREKHPDDIAEAKKLVEEAGLGDGVDLTLSVRNVLGYPDIAILIKEQLQDTLGWNITIKSMESGSGFDAYWAGDFQMAVQSGSIWSTDPDAVWSRCIRGMSPDANHRVPHYPRTLRRLPDDGSQFLYRYRRRLLQR